MKFPRAVVLAALLAACGDPESSSRAAAQAMKPVSFTEWEQVLADQRGAIAVVDLWASWCQSCIERFPHMAELSRRYRDRDVRFLTLNLDDRADAEAVAWSNDFLRTLDGDFRHYRLDENLMEAFARLELLGIPVVLIYGRGGEEVYRLTGDDPNDQFDDEDVEQAVDSLLAGRG